MPNIKMPNIKTTCKKVDDCYLVTIAINPEFRKLGTFKDNYCKITIFDKDKQMQISDPIVNVKTNEIYFKMRNRCGFNINKPLDLHIELLTMSRYLAKPHILKTKISLNNFKKSNFKRKDANK